MKTRILTLVLLLSGLSAYAQKGAEVLPFIRIDRDPATAAMATAGTASSSGIAWSSFKNSAVIPFYQKKMDVAFSYQLWGPSSAASTNNLNLGLGYKVGDRFGISVGGAFQMAKPYTVIEGSGNITEETFTPKDLLIGLGVGFKLTDFLSLGANLRFANQTNAEDAKLSSFGGDVFVLYRAMDALNISAGVASLGTKAGGYGIPASVKVAADYALGFGKSALQADLDVDYYFSGNFGAAAGLQYGWNDMLFARAGYRFATPACVLPSFATLGLGVRFAGVSIDLAYLTANKILGNTLTLGLGYSF